MAAAATRHGWRSSSACAVRLARLINAGSADDIALVQNTSEGLSIVSQGLDWHDRGRGARRSW